uniref:FAM21/CAPZIP domain-containing protein n=1 Tax=Anopheles maculatus TaxID=74869 RepID=A0A182S9P9_9DIPT
VPSVTCDVKDPAAKNTLQTGEVASSEKLTGLNKGRARIPTKRKPPSRQTLRAGTTNSPLLTSTGSKSTVDDDDRIVVGSEGKIEHIEASIPHASFDPPQKRHDDPFVDRLSASVRNPSKRLVLTEGNDGTTNKPLPIVSDRKTPAKPSTKSIFDDSDSNGEDNDDFFKQLPSAKGVVAGRKPDPVPVQDVPTKQQPQRSVAARSIFGSNDEDDDADGEADDLFGRAKKSSIVRQLTGAKTEQTKKGLFDDDDGDSDDDDLFGSKSRTVPKAQSQHQQQVASRSLPPTVTRPVTTTTQTGGDDPLADLLADS